METGRSLFLSLIKSLGLEDRFRIDVLQREWSALFDEPLSSHTCPVSLKEGELLINVDSPLWLQQLKFFTKEITKKLCNHGVTSVKLRHGSIYQPRRYASAAYTRNIGLHTELTAADRAWICETIAEIRDDELRELLGKALEKSLTRKRQR